MIINKSDYSFLFFFLFLLNPLLGILGISVYACYTRKKSTIEILMILVVLYLGALNTNKEPYTDMIRYLEMFNRVPMNGLHGTLTYLGDSVIKDPGYGLLVYVLHYFTFGNQYLFILFVTSLSYGLMFAAIYKFGRAYKMPVYIIVSQVLILSFFTQYFNLSFHLVRQILATSVFFYGLTFKETSFKKFAIWSAIAFSIHSAVFLLIGFSLIPFMQRKLNKKEVILLVLFSVFSIVILSTFASYMLETIVFEGGVRGSVSRVANMEGQADNTEGLNQVLGIVFSVMFIMLWYMESCRKKGMVYPVVVNLGLIVALMILSLSNSPLLQLRFFFFLYSILPFMVVLILRDNISISKMICMTMVFFLIVRFYISLNKITEYIPEWDAVLNPFFMILKLE